MTVKVNLVARPIITDLEEGVVSLGTPLMIQEWAESGHEYYQPLPDA